MKKPWSVRIFLAIEWLRLLGYLLIIIGVSMAPVLTGLSDTVDEALQGFAHGLGLRDIRQLAQEHSHMVGYIVGALAIPAFLTSTALLGVRGRRLWLSRSGVVVHLLLILGQVSQGNPPNGLGVDLVAALVSFLPSFKSYLTQKQTKRADTNPSADLPPN